MLPRLKVRISLGCFVSCLLSSILLGNSTIQNHIADDFIQLRYSQLQQGNFDAIVNSMTLDEKVGQLFLSFFYGEELTPLTREMILESKLGNIIYYNWANGLKEPAQVSELSEQIQTLVQKHFGLPALISADQEGGVVARLQGEKFTEFPGNMAIAATRDPNLARSVSIAMGKEISTVGINWNLAPVVDVNDNPHNPVIGVRSYGDQPEQVIQFGRATLKGYQETGILTSLKHYPGHGNTTVDSHTGLPIVDCSMQELLQVELQPFIELHKDADSIMSAHILLPKIDSKNCASLSKIILQDILRKEIGFKGVIVSDSLVMRGIVPKQDSMEDILEGVTQAAIDAFNAGSDCLILGRPEWANLPQDQLPDKSRELITHVLSGFKRAIIVGEISEQRVDDSIKRILYLKQRIAIQNNRKSDLSDIKSKEHLNLAYQTAEKALTLISPPELLQQIDTKLSNRKILILAPDILNNVLKRSISSFPNIKTSFFNKDEVEKNTEEVFTRLADEAKKSDLTLFYSFNGHVWKEQLSLLQKLCTALPSNRFIIVGLRNPQDILTKVDSNQNLTYLTYSHSLPSLQSMLDSLDQNRLPVGVLPMERLRRDLNAKQKQVELGSRLVSLSTLR